MKTYSVDTSGVVTFSNQKTIDDYAAQAAAAAKKGN